MTFEPIKDFLLIAAQKYGLHRQALGSLVCERVRNIFKDQYPDFATAWVPTKFENGNLFIEVTDSAAGSALFLRTMELGEIFENDDVLKEVQDVRIIRQKINYTLAESGVSFYGGFNNLNAIVVNSLPEQSLCPITPAPHFWKYKNPKRGVQSLPHSAPLRASSELAEWDTETEPA